MLCCSRCKENKPEIEFFKNKSRKTGFGAYCKSCELATKNPEVAKAKSKRYYEKFKQKSFAKSARYRASKLQATPPWLSKEMKLSIDLVYERARSLKDHHVDHIVPLKGKNVCGLHVPWNLQILPSQENKMKYNKEML